MTETTLLTALDPTTLRDMLLQAGYRAEQVKLSEEVVCLRSSTGGVAFEIRFANALPGQGGGTFADAVFQTAFHVRGDLPLPLVNDWNASRRFGRLYVVPSALLLNMDIGVLGGVTADHLRAQLEIWDRLVQEFIVYLREEVPKLAQADAIEEGAPEARTTEASTTEASGIEDAPPLEEAPAA